MARKPPRRARPRPRSSRCASSSCPPVVVGSPMGVLLLAVLLLAVLLLAVLLLARLLADALTLLLDLALRAFDEVAGPPERCGGRFLVVRRRHRPLTGFPFAGRRQPRRWGETAAFPSVVDVDQPGV